MLRMLRRADAAVAAGLLLAVLAIYAPVVGFEFLEWDDGVYVTENPVVRPGLSRATLSGAFTRLVGGNWHPLTVLSHALDVTLFGLDPGRAHGVNALLHALNGLLLYTFLRRATGEVARPALVAALFVAHPLHVESVAWISERKDVLSTFFGWTMLLFYLRWARRPGAAAWAAVTASLLLGLLAKPMLITAPLWLLLLDLWPLGRWTRANQLRPLCREKRVWFVLAGVFGGIALWAQTAQAAVQAGVPVVQRLAGAVVAAAWYLRQTVWPGGLAFFYPRPATVPLAALAAAAVGLGLGTWLALRCRRRHPAVWFGWLWYGVTLLPVLGLVPIGLQARADRYTYVPLVGVFVALAWGVPWRWRPARLAPLPWLAAAALPVLGLAARAQVEHWRDDEPLYRRALAVTSGNFVAHANLAWILERQGRLEQAQAQAEQALALRPGDARALVTLGNVARRQGRRERAEAWYRQATQSDPTSVKAWYNLGAVIHETGDASRAAECYRRALERAPDFAPAHNNLAAALERLHRPAEALEHYALALRLDPSYVEARANHERLSRQLGRGP
jgi:Tfp pilus assembly protein PilF